MRRLECPHCGLRVYFENDRCTACSTDLAFDVANFRMSRVADCAPCENRVHGACNWGVGEEDQRFCRACRLNRTIPDLTVPQNVERWMRIEHAKHRLVYDLLRLGLSVPDRFGDAEGLTFDFLSAEASGPVTTGHASGLITLDIAEAEDSVRAQRRAALHEPYRTLLGHFRHEVGHFYWDRLVRDSPHIAAFRAVFGDEHEDYSGALQKHYAEGPPPGWQQDFVSAYATSHPWEDWAECFAHFLHMVSTLDTTADLPVSVDAKIGRALADPYVEEDFQCIVDAWLPLAESLNELNRSMGIEDAYPFVLTPQVIGKLHLVHMIVRMGARHRAAQPRAA